jgi:hypothetical protein
VFSGLIILAKNNAKKFFKKFTIKLKFISVFSPFGTMHAEGIFALVPG